MLAMQGALCKGKKHNRTEQNRTERTIAVLFHGIPEIGSAFVSVALDLFFEHLEQCQAVSVQGFHAVNQVSIHLHNRIDEYINID
jgi:hypothetical protein